MDFLNKAYGQLADLFKSMTPGARITAGLLLIVVVVSLAYLFNHAGGGGASAYLMGGEVIAGSQLPAMEAAFHKAGLSDYVVEGNRVRVPLGKQSAYMGALADAGAIPPTFGNYMEKAAGSNPWVGKDQQREAIKIAKQAELGLIISNMRGIESAAVMYDVAEKGGLLKEKTTTASISVKTLGGAPLEEEQARMMRHLVASSIAGLKPGNITVSDLSGGVLLSGNSTGSSSGGSDDPYLMLKKLYEREWAGKIGSALHYIPGVVVTSNVELDTETTHETTKTEFDPKTVPYMQRENSLTKTMRGAAPAGRPGPVAQQTNSNQPASVGHSNAGPENNEETSQVDTQMAVSNSTSRTAQHGLTPKRVTVTVSIPSSYYEKMWLEKNPPAAGQPAPKPDANALTEIESKVKKDVQEAVVALLPSPGPTTDPFPRVTVTSFQHLPGPGLMPPALQDKALAWVGQYWSTLGTIGLALVSLLILRSMLRAAPSTAPRPQSAALDQLASERTANPAVLPMNEPLTVRSRLKRHGPSGPSLRDELSELVKEDPDAAVSVLRTWIGNAS